MNLWAVERQRDSSRGVRFALNPPELSNHTYHVFAAAVELILNPGRRRRSRDGPDSVLLQVVDRISKFPRRVSHLPCTTLFWNVLIAASCRKAVLTVLQSG